MGRRSPSSSLAPLAERKELRAKRTWFAIAAFALLASGASQGVAAAPGGQQCTAVSPGILDGTFEAGPPWPAWTLQSSTNFGTPLCTPSICGTGGGTALPYSGSNWAWFGGSPLPENAALGQDVVLPAVPDLRLRFQMWIGYVTDPFYDLLYATVDGGEAMLYQEPPLAEAGYSTRDVGITLYADGATHQLGFQYFGGFSNFNVDDVQLVSCTVPEVSISDVSVQEGDSGTVDASFIVSLSFPSDQTVTVDYVALPGTASPGDYGPSMPGYVHFPPGTTSLPIVVPVYGDTLMENDETFTVNLTTVFFGTIVDGTATGTILNDDFPTLAISDSTVPESAGTAEFVVTLSSPSPQTISVSYATADGTATAPADYVPASGLLTLGPGVISQTLAVTINDDTMDEDDETFTLALSSPVHVVVPDATAIATILDDDAPPVVAAGLASVLETNAGAISLPLPVALSVPSGKAVAVDYATADGSATVSSGDYLARAGTLSFPAGTTLQVVPVPVVGDTVPEADETLLVNLANPSNATLGTTPGTGTIINDDGIASSYGGELAHGTDLVRHLAGTGPSAPFTLYRLMQLRYSSYEALVDGTSGDLGASGPGLTRLDADGATVIQDSIPAGANSSRSLRWQNTAADNVDWEFLRVASLGCSTDCGPDDVYRIRAYETTLAAPRFNNTGSQVTVFQLQNPTASAVGGTLYFWSPSGTLLVSQLFSLAPRATFLLNTATVAGLSGQSGTLTVSHSARYGELVGKTVALEPATGFTFDTPLVARPR